MGLCSSRTSARGETQLIVEGEVSPHSFFVWLRTLISISSTSVSQLGFAGARDESTRPLGPQGSVGDGHIGPVSIKQPTKLPRPQAATTSLVRNLQVER